MPKESRASRDWDRKRRVRLYAVGQSFAFGLFFLQRMLDGQLPSQELDSTPACLRPRTLVCSNQELGSTPIHLRPHLVQNPYVCVPTNVNFAMVSHGPIPICLRPPALVPQLCLCVTTCLNFRHGFLCVGLPGRRPSWSWPSGTTPSMSFPARARSTGGGTPTRQADLLACVEGAVASETWVAGVSMASTLFVGGVPTAAGASRGCLRPLLLKMLTVYAAACLVLGVSVPIAFVTSLSSSSCHNTLPARC